MIISANLFIFGIGNLPYILFYLGIIVMVFGFILRQWAISVLGIYFAPTVRIIKKHEIIGIGPYKYIRHPSYTGMLLFLIGFAFISRSLISLLGIIFPIIGYWYRIKVEEKSLLLHLKKEYKGYMQKTFRLIPFLF